MDSEAPKPLTVKNKFKDCKVFECPRLLDLCETREDEKKRIREGSLAYTAIVRCNNWSIGLSDGNCPLVPTTPEA